jgi:hypothetical protein
MSSSPQSPRSAIHARVPADPVLARELVTVCRHIGGMMEAGVDILRITRVLRAQTHTPRLLELYDHLDHELTMGRAISDALACSGDLFSPFAVSLVRQGEERNALAASFLRLADFLQQELPAQSAATESQRSDSDFSTGAPSTAPENSDAPTCQGKAAGMGRGGDELAHWWGQANWLGAGLLAACAVAEAAVLAGALPRRWGGVASRGLCAAVLGLSAARASARPVVSRAGATDEPAPGELRAAPERVEKAGALESPEAEPPLAEVAEQEAAPQPAQSVYRGIGHDEEEPERRFVRPREEEDFE